jgi:hypothetical protein
MATDIISDLSARVEALEARLRRLEDERQVLRTLHQYAHALDYGADAAEFLDCFVPDGVWYSTIEGKWAGGGGVRLAGHAELRAWFERHAERGVPGHFTKHYMVEPEIVLEDDRATVMSYFSSIHEESSGPLLYSMGRYVDVAVRCPDGRWRLEERHLSREGVHTSGQQLTAG